MPVSSVRCASGAEAARVLADDARARFFGGGTLLMRAVNEADPSFDTIVRADDASFGDVRVDGTRLSIGAGVTMAALLANRDAAFLHPAARLVGGPAVRNAATVGGNLFAPSPYGDLATALLALDGVASFADGGDAPLEQLFAERGPLGDLPPRRVVRAVSVLRPSSPDAFRFAKVSRVKPKGISVLALAVHLPRAGSGLGDVRVAWGAMGPTPVRGHAVEQALAGRPLDAASIEAAVRVASDGLEPPTDAIASSWYRRQVAPVHLGRLLGGESAR